MDRTPAAEAGGLGSIPGKCRIFNQNRSFSQRKCGLLELYLRLVTFSGARSVGYLCMYIVV